MLLTKVSLSLIVLLVASALALFINDIKIRENLNFNERRINELEKRPLMFESDTPAPEAGESGRVMASQTISPTGTSKPTASPIANTKKITYLPIYGNTETTSTNWVDVQGSDFQLKASDYGSVSYFTWEAIVYLIGGSGEVRLRIYDTTNNVSVNGSEISLTNASYPSLVISGRLSFFSGNNTYRVQLSSLTSSTAVFKFGRVRAVYQ